MAVKLIYQKPDGTSVLSCLAADDKPTNYRAGSIIYVIDIPAKFEFYADAGWIGRGTNGAANVAVQNFTTLSFPQEWKLDITGLAGGADTNEIYISPDVSEYDYHVIENSDDATAVDVYVSVDGTNYGSTAAAIRLINDVTTGGGIDVITVPAGGIGILRGRFKKIKILQDGSGTIAAGAVRGFHGVN